MSDLEAELESVPEANESLPAEQPAAGPFGFWMTSGLTVLTIVLWGILQSIVLIVYARQVDLQLRPTEIEALSSNGFFLGLVTVTTAPFAIALTWLWVWLRRRHYSIKAYLALNPVPWQTLLLWCAVGVGVAFGADLAKEALGLPTESAFVIESYKTAQPFWLYVLAIAIMAPLWEELLFRGFVYEGYAKTRAFGSLGPMIAIVLPAVIWAVIHMQYEVHDIVTIFVLGLTIGLARWRTDSLYVPVAMHCLLNSLAIVSVMYTQS